MSETKRPAVPEHKAHANGGRSAAQIEADLTVTRERLAATVDTLVERVQPKEVAARSAARAKLVVMTPEGRLRTGRLVTVALAAAAVIGTLKLLRVVVRRRD